jgi:hypothetical protein
MQPSGLFVSLGDLAVLEPIERTVMARQTARARLVGLGGCLIALLVGQLAVSGSPAAAATASPTPGWTGLNPAASPSARAALVAYDPSTSQLILFGGVTANSVELNDTWAWNGTTWSQVDDSTDPGCTSTCTSSPPARAEASMAYDPGTGQLLLVAGTGNGGVLNDSWTWNGTTWSQVDDSADPGCSDTCTSSPPARLYASMAYDPGSAQLVLFGGNGSGDVNFNDTWAWNGTTWSQVDDSADPGCSDSCASSPGARDGASVAYDPATAQLVLFAGYGSGDRNDTWAWNGTTWSQVDDSADPGCATTCTSSPPVRFYASMAYDPATAQLVLFGGQGTGSDLNDTWTWNGSSWVEASPPTSPSARQGAALAYDPASGQLLLFGGYGSSSFLGDTSTWGYSSGVGTGWAEQFPASSPPTREWGSMAYDPGTGQLILFGGNVNGSYANDTWAFDGTSWNQVDDSADPGCTTACTSSPSPREVATMAYDPGTGQLILFGGAALGGNRTDTWAWNGTTWSQIDDSGDPGCGTACTSSPPPTSGASMAYDPATGRIVLFGGFDTNYDSDTWAWNGTTWTQVDDGGDPGCTSTCASSPPARYWSSIAYDPVAGQLILFAGYDGGRLNDTWAWNGTTWNQVGDSADPGCFDTCTSSPPARDGASMAYDAATTQLVLFGGYNTNYDNDTWAWGGTTWSQVDDSADPGCTTACTSSPPGREFASMAYDPATAQLILLYGAGSISLSDTWAYIPVASVQVPPRA